MAGKSNLFKSYVGLIILSILVGISFMFTSESFWPTIISFAAAVFFYIRADKAKNDKSELFTFDLSQFEKAIDGEKALFERILKIQDTVTNLDKRITTNGQLGSVIQDSLDYSPIKTTIIHTSGDVYQIGKLRDIAVYIDPQMKWTDNRIIWDQQDSHNRVWLNVTGVEKFL